MLYCSFVDEVVELFKFMVDEGIEFDEVFIFIILKVMLGFFFVNLSSCRSLYFCVVKLGLEFYIVVLILLIDLYFKMG